MFGRKLLYALLLALAVGLPRAWADDLGEAQRLAETGDVVGALRRVELALSARPKDAQLRFAKGVLLTDLKREAEAAAIFQQLNEDFPELPDPLNNLAVIHAAQGRLDEARVALEAALRNDAMHRNARENLADVYVRLAIRLWQGLAVTSPTDATLARKLKLGRELLRAPT